MVRILLECILICIVFYGLFSLPESDSDPNSEMDSNPNSEMDSCIMQNFSTGSDLDSDPLIEMYIIGMEI